MPENDATDSRAITTVRPVQLRGRFLTAVALLIEGGPPDQRFFAALDAQLRRMPHFLSDAPLMIDLANAPHLTRAEDLRHLRDELQKRKLAPFAVQNASPAQIAAGADAGLISVVAGHDAPQRPTRREPAGTVAKPAKPRAAANRLVTTPVRSGQSIVAEHGDLVIVGHVASGAELIAAGNIHVYGALRGRAMAGVHGDENARIFCQSLDAELLAIAGLYRTSENLEHGVRKRSVHIFLQDQRLCVETLA